jgi:glucose/arabinose dehydrogenase
MNRSTLLALCAGALLGAPAAFAADRDPDAAYAVEEIKLPAGIAPEIGALAFNGKGELVVVTRRSGILIGKPNRDPSAFEWRVFSDQSLHEALGVLVEKDNQLLVSQFPELTRITDTDGDGAADLYETVCDAWGLSGGYHENAGNITPDGEGNWFLNIGTASHNGITFDRTRGQYSPVGRRGRNFSAVEYRGWVIKVKPDGTMIPWASGFRANNGLCRGPDGNLWATDNQGDYIPTSPLHHVEQGKFYGHPSSLVWDKEFTKGNPERDPLKEGADKLDAMRTKPAVQFPHGIMVNSPGDPIFDLTKGKFGPFAGQMFVPDESGQRILRVMLEKVGGAWQGACTYLHHDNGLRAGNNRVVFSPDGGALYTGQTMRGWGGPVEGLQRIVHTGKPIFEVHEIHLQPDGFELTFTEPVEPTFAAEAARYHVQRYYYPYSHQYGSRQAEITKIETKQAALSADGRKVRITLGEMMPGRIYQLDLVGLVSAAGRPLVHPTLCYTVNQLVR